MSSVLPRNPHCPCSGPRSPPAGGCVWGQGLKLGVSGQAGGPPSPGGLEPWVPGKRKVGLCSPLHEPAQGTSVSGRPGAFGEAGEGKAGTGVLSPAEPTGRPWRPRGWGADPPLLGSRLLYPPSLQKGVVRTSLSGPVQLRPATSPGQVSAWPGV